MISLLKSAFIEERCFRKSSLEWWTWDSLKLTARVRCGSDGFELEELLSILFLLGREPRLSLSCGLVLPSGLELGGCWFCCKEAERWRPLLESLRSLSVVIVPLMCTFLHGLFRQTPVETAFWQSCGWKNLHLSSAMWQPRLPPLPLYWNL